MPTIPNVFFNTTNTGTTPINPLVKNRIAIVGQFDRGVVGIPTYGLGDLDVKQRYGFEDLPGDLAYRAARSQQAENFALVRVLGQGKQASAALLLNGYATVDNTLNFAITNVGTIEKETSDPSANFLTVNSLITQTASNRQGTLYFYVWNIDSTPGNESVTFSYVFHDINANNTIPIDWTLVTDQVNVNVAASQLVDGNLTLDLDFPNLALTQIGDVYSVDLFEQNVTVNVQANEVASQINSSIIQAFLATGYFESVERTANDDGVILTLSPDIAEGSVGNGFDIGPMVTQQPDNFLVLNGSTFTDWYYQFTTYGNPLAPITFAGGSDGATNAYKDFYAIDSTPLLRLMSASPGNWGNNLRITIYPTSITEFKLTIVDTNQPSGENTEVFIINLSEHDSEGYLTQLETSQYVRGLFLPVVNYLPNASIYEAFSPLRTDFLDPLLNTALPVDLNPTHPDHYGFEYTQEIPLVGGFDGPVVGDADYIDAINSLSSFPAHIILTDGLRG